MWNLILYLVAVIIGLILYYTYDENEDEECSRQQEPGSPVKPSVSDFRFSSLFAVLGFPVPGATSEERFESFTEHFSTFDEVAEACWRAGLESSSLVIGVDFTASNEWKGRKSFNQNCLHRLVGSKVTNPYQKVISILGQTLAPFDDDNRIPTYGFGDTETRDHSVFPFRYDEKPCEGFEEVLQLYNEVVRRVTLSGPSSLAPIIRKAVDTVKETGKYHILVIITDGQIRHQSETIKAITEASLFPLSIIAVGVGDGPWNTLEQFDARLPYRKFDNFRFVDYHRTAAKTKSPDMAFALQAMMEIPDQYKRIKELGYLEKYRIRRQVVQEPKIPEATPSQPSHCSTKSSPVRVIESLRHRSSNPL